MTCIILAALFLINGVSVPFYGGLFLLGGYAAYSIAPDE